MATKKELLQQEVAKAVGAGKAVALETVDFNDPNRPKTCLEVDFPILPVNQVAIIEGNAGKPIYQMSKWWARRRSSVFRSMLIAAATKAPDDPSHAAKLVWDNYYANHQKKGAFKHLKVDDATYDLVTVEGTRRARFTLSREAATSQDALQLMGLDHPFVQEELGRWRSVPPEEVGIAVSGDVDEPVLLSLWMVEASAGKGERRVVVQPIAVKQDGTRVPAVERLCEKYLQAPPTAPTFQPEQRIDLFARAVEPTLQRELKHKGAANGDGSYSAELIGYVEIIGRGA